MKNVLVYPFDAEFVPVLRHRDFLKETNITKIISPEGWGLNGKSISDYGCHSNLKIDCNFEDGIDFCDSVFIINSKNPVDFKSLIYTKLLAAVRKNKKIIIARDILDEDSSLIKKLPANADITILGRDSYTGFNKTALKHSLYSFDTPIVFVEGDNENTDKFEIQLAIRAELLKMGYGITQIGSRPFCELLGFHSMPSFMLEPGFTETDKILMFNRYLKTLELKEHPELMIVGIPGGCFQISDSLAFDFGILAMEIYKSVSPDFVIFSSLYSDYKEEYFSTLSNDMKNKFGYKVDCHNMSNMMLDWSDSEVFNELSYLTIDPEFVIDKIKKYKGYNDTVFDIYEEGSAKRMTEKMLDRLSAYSYVKYI